MAITAKDQLARLQEQEKSIKQKIAKLKQKQLQDIVKLADKHSFVDWDNKAIEKAFLYIAEMGESEFLKD